MLRPHRPAHGLTQWGRKDRLRSPDRLELCVILDAAVLRRPIGGAVVLRKRPERLLDATGPTASLSARPPWAADLSEGQGGRTIRPPTLPAGERASLVRVTGLRAWDRGRRPGSRPQFAWRIASW
ncbi:Scr1 family TA system antitoxin-like transcriptional regulator [Streptomyces griseoincarnatus]